jgi:hypothetical protein
MSEATPREPGQLAPRGWISRLIYALTRRRFGHLIPSVALHGYSEGRLLGFCWMTVITGRFRQLDPAVGLLAQLRVAALIDCEY